MTIETSESPIVIFDLDGTLIEGNSFHELVRLMASPRSGDTPRMMAMRLRIALAAGLRFIRVLPRRFFKRLVHQTVVSEANPLFDRSVRGPLVETLLALTRADVIEALRHSQRMDGTTVLSTGALREYAEPYAERLGFDVVVSTEFEGDQWTENIGVTKRNRTLLALARRGVVERRRILVADDPDDWPLADACEACLWCSPRAIRPDKMDSDFSEAVFRTRFDDLCNRGSDQA